MSRWKEKLDAFRKKAGMTNIFLLLLAGGLLLLSSASGLFSGDKKEPDQGYAQPDAGNAGEAQEMLTANEVGQWEEKLEKLLADVKGVGRANVMITLSDSGEKIVLKDGKSSTESLNETDGSGGSRVNITAEKEESTVRDAGNAPYVTREVSAQVAGVLVVCEGGGNADVVLQIVSVAEALFGIPAHRIVVLEMK